MPQWFASGGALCHHLTARHTKHDVDIHVDDDLEHHHPLQSMHQLHTTAGSLLHQKRKLNCNDSDTSTINQFENDMLFDVPNFDNTSSTGSNLSF